MIYIIYRFPNRLLVTAQGRFNHGGRDLISIGAFAPYATQSNELQNSRRQWTSQKMEMLDARNGVEDEFELCRVQLTQLVRLTSDIPVADMLLQVFGIDMY